MLSAARQRSEPQVLSAMIADIAHHIGSPSRMLAWPPNSRHRAKTTQNTQSAQLTNGCICSYLIITAELHIKRSVCARYDCEEPLLPCDKNSKMVKNDNYAIKQHKLIQRRLQTQCTSMTCSYHSKRKRCSQNQPFASQEFIWPKIAILRLKFQFKAEFCY